MAIVKLPRRSALATQANSEATGSAEAPRGQMQGEAFIGILLRDLLHCVVDLIGEQDGKA
jgi:hypothetical protein